MKLALAALLVFASAIPAEAKPKQYHSRSGWAEEQKCYRKEYREEYIPGTSTSPGYVKTYRENVEVPCENSGHHHTQPSPPPNVGKNTDDNSCIEGSILGGILGGGAGAAASRGDGRYWAIPLGIVGGAMVGCQIDGG